MLQINRHGIFKVTPSIAILIASLVIVIFIHFISGNQAGYIAREKNVNNIFIKGIGVSFYCPENYHSGGVTTAFILSEEKRNFTNLTRYITHDGSFGFSFPSAFRINSKELFGGEIQHHIEITDETGKVRILVQVWELGMPVSDFLEMSKKTSRLKMKYFNESNVNTDKGLSGTLWEYAYKTPDGMSTKSSEAFLSNNNKLYRISIFAPEIKWKDGLADVFSQVLNSFEIS